jgi:hypothetical protein
MFITTEEKKETINSLYVDYARHEITRKQLDDALNQLDRNECSDDKKLLL